MLWHNPNVLQETHQEGARGRAFSATEKAIWIGRWLAINNQLVLLVAGSQKELPSSRILLDASGPYTHLAVMEEIFFRVGCPWIGLGGSDNHIASRLIPYAHVRSTGIVFSVPQTTPWRRRPIMMRLHNHQVSTRRPLWRGGLGNDPVGRAQCCTWEKLGAKDLSHSHIISPLAVWGFAKEALVKKDLLLWWKIL